jgi:hypothetical protein
MRSIITTPMLAIRLAFLFVLSVASSLHVCVAGDPAEHRRMGSDAIDQAIRKSPELRRQLAYYKIDSAILRIEQPSAEDLVLTYGDLCAAPSLRGRAMLETLRELQNGILTSTTNRIRVSDTLRRQLIELRSASNHDHPLETMDHRVRPATSYAKQLHVIDVTLMREMLPIRIDHEERLAFSNHVDTADWTLPEMIPGYLTAPAVFALLDARAHGLRLYSELCNNRDVAARFVRLFLVTAAFADHYYQDLFASDHHIRDCNEAHESALLVSREDSTLEQQGCREYYRIKGIRFWFERQGDNAILYGDGHYTDDQMAKALRGATVLQREISSERQYDDYVADMHRVARRRPDSAMQYSDAFRDAPIPLNAELYEQARFLRRSIWGPYGQISVAALTQGRTFGGALEASVGTVIPLRFSPLPRSREAGYESSLALVPSLSAAYGISRDRWFALVRAGLGMQVVDGLRVGVSSGPYIRHESFTGSRAQFPVFVDVTMLSKPLSFLVGLEFTLSAAVTQNSPYDVKLGVGVSLY